MSDVIHLEVEGVKYEMQMPGAFDQDDRYRGGISAKKIGADRK